MTKALGAMMTGIIMAGRTGAAFAAELGTMKVTEELDALATMGISSIEFLVLPRVIALVLMMPLLCLYADFVGVLGGATVGLRKRRWRTNGGGVVGNEVASMCATIRTR